MSEWVTYLMKYDVSLDEKWIKVTEGDHKCDFHPCPNIAAVKAHASIGAFWDVGGCSGYNWFYLCEACHQKHIDLANTKSPKHHNVRYYIDYEEQTNTEVWLE